MKSPLLYFIYLFSLSVAAGLVSCNGHSDQAPTVSPLFTSLSSDSTKVRFSNTLTEGPNTNILMYEYFYNGGGVAAGDLNNDGLDDLYFTANMDSNRIYLNRGSMHFEEITGISGAAGRPGPWKTGISMADINGDGWLDLYLCYSGNLRAQRLIPQVFINQGADKNGVPHFTDMTREYGLSFPFNSTQAYFFDMDRDSDLDLFILNHNPKTLPPMDETTIQAIRNTKDSSSALRLFRNDMDKNGLPHFSEITGQAGIEISFLNYGLGAGIADINDDGFADIYVGNDYLAPDHLYINNGNGTFTDRIREYLDHTSQFSMGVDVTDINNDGLNDIFSLDMLPADNKRQKLLMPADNYEKFDLGVKAGLHYQYMRNMLHLNNGNGSFSEVGQMANISNTDWSWSGLFADYDNDGFKDLFVTNGYLRDFTNQDFIKYLKTYLQDARHNLSETEILKLINEMPASDVVNYIFRNEGGITFSDRSNEWGMKEATNSSGAAYSDLDNDGDLDLVVNNINKPASVFRNESNTRKQNGYLKFRLEGAGFNRNGVGAKILVYQSGSVRYVEQQPARGYQSSVSQVLHLGTGTDRKIDSVKVIWNSGKSQKLVNVPVNQLITLKESAAAGEDLRKPQPKSWFKETAGIISYTHPSSEINDFKRQPLLVNPLSYGGPCMAKADIDGDGLEDLFIGGGNGRNGQLFRQGKDGRFREIAVPAMVQEKGLEDGAAQFFDANRDGHTDLYIASGGYHTYQPDDARLQDRLFLGDGKGGFVKSADALPVMKSSKTSIAVADINGDGYPDLFVGGRVIPGRYPEIPESYLLLNDGKGHFRNVTNQWFKGLERIGLVTTAQFEDLDADGLPELVVAGEWLPITVLKNLGNGFEDRTRQYFEKPLSGWWNTVVFADLNKDGRKDMIAGNYGLNSQCRASDAEPAEMYYKDFDENGAVDPILCLYNQGKSYPYASRDELLDQVSLMRTRFTNYASYASAGIGDVFTPEELKGAGHLKANTLETAVFIRTDSGRFQPVPLPELAQMAPVYAIGVLDYDRDGDPDLLLGGNISHSRLRFGRSDANHGMLLQNDGKGQFQYVQQGRSGFDLRGDVRSILTLNDRLIIGINEQPVRVFTAIKQQ